MKKALLTTALVLLASPALAKEYTIKEVSDPDAKKPYFFSPDTLTIQPGDTVTFENAQDEMHDVMFISQPKGVDEMIMSPMHEKKGDKFSYTFTVPGTYKFHCHPHEALKMNGTIIVGTPSKPGETKAMDHHKMSEKAEGGSDGHADHQHEDAAAGLTQGTGKVNSVDASKRSINITHDPIKALGWPKMKMEFQVDEGVDLSNIKEGDAVAFGLKEAGEDYTVATIKKAQ